MARADLIIRSNRVVLPTGVGPATIAIGNGRILKIIDNVAPSVGGDSSHTIDAGDAVVMPGLIDTHVHINDPGRADWEGFETATRAAAAGGITTLIDMPLNSIPATTSAETLDAKRAAAADRCAVDVGFWGGIVPGNTADIPGLIAEGVLGFKCFLSPSGVDEFGSATEADIRAAAPMLVAAHLPLLVHAEDPAFLSRAPAIPRGQERSYAAYLATRPPEAERAAIEMLIRIARETKLRIHIVHLADAGSITTLAAARAEGLPITVETCHHYLTFAAEDIADGATQLKCAPPIRDRASREGLWDALRAGTIDIITTDHSPSPPEGKHMDSGDFARAWGGIASLELALPIAWTGASARGFDLADIARWMSDRPAKLAGLIRNKGRIAPGYDADLVIWRPESEFTVRGDQLHHRHPITPYDGMRLRGVVDLTLVRGDEVFADGSFAEEPTGQLIARELR